MLALNNRYNLELEVTNGSNLVVPSHRIPAGLYLLVSTAYGQWNTPIKVVMADYSVHWNKYLIIQGRPLSFLQWLFPSASTSVRLEIRASFETVMLGRGELLGRVETTLEDLLVHGKQFEIQFPITKNGHASLLLKARSVRSQQLIFQGTVKSKQIDIMTDEARDAYALYRKNNHLNDLERALTGFRAVLDRCVVGHSHRAAALSNLAHAILYGSDKGAQTDIDYAISLFRSALELCPKGRPDHPLSVHNLCKARLQRYSHLQDRADLREAVKLYRELLPICIKGSYFQLRVIEECNELPRDPSDESISLRRMVLDYCPQGHKHCARAMSRLAGDLHARFEETGNSEDIHNAVHMSRKALDVCSIDGERSFFLSTLSYILKLRFLHLRNPEDINECILLNGEALSLRPEGHPARQRTLNNLAKALKARYDVYGDTNDFEHATSFEQAAKGLWSVHSGIAPSPSHHSEQYLDVERGPLTYTPEPEEEQEQRPPLKSLFSKDQTSSRTRNIVIFGESGSGKSSVINAIAQHPLARTSNSAAGCTFRYERHEVDLHGERFVLFDTVGLNEGTAGTVPAAEAEENLRSLLRELMNSGSDGIGLLVYCVRSVRISRALLRNYNLFYSAICRKKVPIVVVVTGLENQEPTMDSWWYTNGKEFKNLGMRFEDHACVTTLPKRPNVPDAFTQRMTESSEVLRNLILSNCSEWKADESWFKLSFADVRHMIGDRWNIGRSSPRTLVICDPAQKDVEIARGVRGEVETCALHINGTKYQVHIVPEPKLPTPTSNIEADLLIYYAHVDEQDHDAARRRFGTFCAAYRGNMIPVVVVVKGLDSSEAAQKWVERYFMHSGAGRPFGAFIPAGDVRDPNAERELLELIQQSCLIRREDGSSGVYKSIVSSFNSLVSFEGKKAVRESIRAS